MNADRRPPEIDNRTAAAQRTLAVIAAWTILAAGATAALIFRSTPPAVDKTAQLVERFALSAPALLPSGSLYRQGPQAAAAVDLRFSPQLPAADPAPTKLLLSRPAPR